MSEWLVLVQTEFRGTFVVSVVEADSEEEAKEKAREAVMEKKSTDPVLKYDRILMYWVEPA